MGLTQADEIYLLGGEIRSTYHPPPNLAIKSIKYKVT